MMKNTQYRFFVGSETKQISGVDGKPADANKYYFEPADYEGDVLWSRGFVAYREAAEAADLEIDDGANL